jgi:hypothetical protein
MVISPWFARFRVEKMPGDRNQRRIWNWIFAKWNAVIMLRVITGHAGVKGTGSERKVLVTITLVTLWPMAPIVTESTWSGSTTQRGP